MKKGRSVLINGIKTEAEESMSEDKKERVWLYVSSPPDLKGDCELAILDNDYYVALVNINTNSDIFKKLISIPPSQESPFSFSTSLEDNTLH